MKMPLYLAPAGTMCTHWNIHVSNGNKSVSTFCVHRRGPENHDRKVTDVKFHGIQNAQKTVCIQSPAAASGTECLELKSSASADFTRVGGVSHANAPTAICVLVISLISFTTPGYILSPGDSDHPCVEKSLLNRKPQRSFHLDPVVSPKASSGHYENSLMCCFYHQTSKKMSFSSSTVAYELVIFMKPTCGWPTLTEIIDVASWWR